MSNSISGIGGMSSMMMTGMQRPPRPDSSQLAEDLFSKIDSTGKGYIEQADLEAALESANASTSADKLFSSLDGDGDGKVTQDEMTSGLKTLMSALDSQFQSGRMSEAMGGMPPPPPPPPEGDTGFTADELQAQLDEIGDTDSARSSLISNIIENFDAADTDGDGKVTFQEAMAYDQSTGSGSSDGTMSTASASASSEAQLMSQIMKLAEAYGLFAHRSGSSGVTEVA